MKLSSLVFLGSKTIFLPCLGEIIGLMFPSSFIHIYFPCKSTIVEREPGGDAFVSTTVKNNATSINTVLAYSISVIDSTGDPCLNSASCTNDLENGYICRCRDGYAGQWCSINIDECAGHNCQNGATCVDQVRKNYSIIWCCHKEPPQGMIFLMSASFILVLSQIKVS